MQMVKTNNENKVILIGDASVGKTSIISQLHLNIIDPKVSSTIGASFISHTVSTESGPVTLHIWDTAGQERFRSLIPMYSRHVTTCVVVTDITSKESFDSLDQWIAILQQNSPKAKIYVVANKIDLEPIVSIDTIESYCKAHNYSFFKCSAFDHDSVVKIFDSIALDSDPKKPTENGETKHVEIKPKEKTKEESSSCC